MKAISQCYNLNKKIKELDLVKLTWGNASVLDDGFVYIKPSGVNVSSFFPDECYCKVNILDGQNMSNKKPSVDLDTHLEIYRGFSEVGAVIHTHSKYATSFAQAGLPISCMGTTHADYFRGDIPVVPSLQNLDDYERDTGRSIVSYYKENKIDHHEINACLVEGHGVFVWDKTPEKCLESTLVLELLAEMAYNTLVLGGAGSKLPDHILHKHYDRKHGSKKYYGQ